jgi:hypothetical protein
MEKRAAGCSIRRSAGWPQLWMVTANAQSYDVTQRLQFNAGGF